MCPPTRVTISASASSRSASSGTTKRRPRCATASENLTAAKPRLRGIEAELGPAAFRVRFGFAAALLVRRLKRTKPAHFLQDPLGVELVLQALQRPVDGFTFTNNHFRHVSSSFLKMSGFGTGAAEPTRAAGRRQLL